MLWLLVVGRQAIRWWPACYLGKGVCGAELEVATSGRVGNDACTFIRHPGGCCQSVLARALPRVFSAMWTAQPVPLRDACAPNAQHSD